MPHNLDLPKYRLQMAEECLNDAKILLKEESFRGSAGRSYYCVFHAMRAVLALDELDFKKHSGVISCFRKHYVLLGKFGEFGKKLSSIIDDLFNVRGKSDYDDFYVIPKAAVKEQLESTEFFLDKIKAFLITQGIKN